MTPNQESVLSRYGISKPPEWRGMVGQGADTLYSVDGRWMRTGQKHPSGYIVGQYDPKTKSLGMSIHGVNLPVSMKSGTIQNFESPSNPYDKPMFSNNAGAYSADPTGEVFGEKDNPNDWKIPSGTNAISLDDFAKAQKYAVPQDMMSKIRANAIGSGGMSDFDAQNMMHIKEYAEAMKKGSLKPNTKYYIPTSDGQVDVFTTREDKYE